MRNSLCALLLVLALPANAVPVRFDFVTSAPTDGTLSSTPPVEGFGYVVFDTDLAGLADSNGRVGDGNTPLATIDVQFNWLGQEYNLTNATLGAVTFSGGMPIAWQIDALTESPFCNTASSGGIFNRFDCVQFGTDDFTLSAFAGGSGTVLLSTSQDTSYARANVMWTQGQVAVPEPSTAALLALALLGTFVRRRSSTSVLKA